MEKQLTEFIEITPDWDSMFEFAEEIVRAEIDKDSGQEFVLVMLEYGRRLNYEHAKLFKKVNK